MAAKAQDDRRRVAQVKWRVCDTLLRLQEGVAGAKRGRGRGRGMSVVRWIGDEILSGASAAG